VLLKEQAEKRDEAPLVVLGPQPPPEEEKHDPVEGARAIEKPPAAEQATPPEAPEKEPAPKVEEKKAPASAVIRAVDQRGKLLTQGMLVMRLAGEADPDEEMISVVTSLEMERDPLHLPRALAQENPVVLEGIPDILNGQEIQARVRTGGV